MKHLLMLEVLGVSVILTAFCSGCCSCMVWEETGKVTTHVEETRADFTRPGELTVRMTGWQETQTLRFATLELVRSDWRKYTASRLTDRGYSVAGTGTISTSTVNIEENAGSYPVNYVLPPGIDRVIDPGQSTSTQLNEQAMVLDIEDLEPHDAVAVYKNSGMDMRQYDNIQPNRPDRCR